MPLLLPVTLAPTYKVTLPLTPPIPKSDYCLVYVAWPQGERTAVGEYYYLRVESDMLVPNGRLLREPYAYRKH